MPHDPQKAPWEAAPQLGQKFIATPQFLLFVVSSYLFLSLTLIWNLGKCDGDIVLEFCWVIGASTTLHQQCHKIALLHEEKSDTDGHPAETSGGTVGVTLIAVGRG